VGLCLGRAGYTIANGGYGGTMEAAAQGAKLAQAPTIGVTCDAFGRNGPNQWIDKEIRTSDLNGRLEKLIQIGQGYVILPGGTGTLLEIAMVWELINKHFISSKPMIFMTDFWKPIIETVEKNDKSENFPIFFEENPENIVTILQNSLI
jgi:hypothetical protein